MAAVTNRRCSPTLSLQAKALCLPSPESNIGILPDDCATQRLTRVAGKLPTKLMILPASLSAHTELQASLVTEVVENGGAQAHAFEIANIIAQ